MESAPTVSRPPVCRVQDAIVAFFAEQTKLSIRINQDLQDQSQELLERIRKVMGNKLPLNFSATSFSNCFYQSLFQMLSVGLGSVLKMGSIKMGLDANFEAEGPDRTTFKAMSDSYNVGAHLCEQIFAAVITYTKGLGETHGFNSEELQKYFDGNRACRESVRGAHDLLASTVKQMGSH